MIYNTQPNEKWWEPKKEYTLIFYKEDLVASHVTHITLSFTLCINIYGRSSFHVCHCGGCLCSTNRNIV